MIPKWLGRNKPKPAPKRDWVEIFNLASPPPIAVVQWSNDGGETWEYPTTTGEGPVMPRKDPRIQQGCVMKVSAFGVKP